MGRVARSADEAAAAEEHSEERREAAEELPRMGLRELLEKYESRAAPLPRLGYRDYPYYQQEVRASAAKGFNK